MTLEGFTPYGAEVADLYEKRRWWLGITLGDMFDKSSDLYPDKVALIGEDKRFTYGQLRELIDSIAYQLHEMGFRRGDRVLLQLPNWVEFYMAYFALQKIGCVVVLLTVNHTSREISHLASLTQPKGWILPASYRKTDYLELVEHVQKANPCLEKVILCSETPVPGFVMFNSLSQVEVGKAEIQQVLESARPEPGDVCQILPSGGTTGLPKGAPRTHNDYICNVEYKSRAWDVNVNDVCLVASTVGHNLALLVCVTAPVFHGATVALLDSTYPEDFCKMVQREKVTCTAAVPTIVVRIVNSEKVGNYDLTSLKKMYVGAAHSAPELVNSVEEKLGCRYINAFGMVEGPCAQSRPSDSFEIRTTSVGRPICPYDDFRTLDATGKPTPRGVEGEMAAKGPGIFTGYFKNPQANQTAFTPDGYFRTGDLAVIDEQGNVRITGRIKDIIIRGGENIAAQEVEELISSHPKVELASAIGVPHKIYGEEVCAYVKCVGNAKLEPEEIREHLSAVGASKIVIPSRFEFIDQMPMTAAGKIDKKALKEDIQKRMQADDPA